MHVITTYDSTPEIDEAERLLKEQLRALDIEYVQYRKPILDKLAELHAMKIPRITVVSS